MHMSGLNCLPILRDQPNVLYEPAEVLIPTHHGYRILVQPTRDRKVLLDSVGRHDPGLGQPFRDYIEETGDGGAADFTLTKTSMQAIWSLALQQRSVPGRKLVIWLGVGGPNLTSHQPVKARYLSPAQRYSREITDLLVEARITLDVIGPGGERPTIPVGGASVALYVATYRYESDFGFSGYISATGGRWANGNDVRGEIQTSANYGSAYYTISYRPTNPDFDGEFRRIRVTVKGHPEWTVLTKGGYYAMQFGGEEDSAHQLQEDMSIATFEAMPFTAIGVTLTQIERIKDTDSARFTFELDSDDLQWRTDSTDGVGEADVAISGSPLGSVFAKDTLSSQTGVWKLTIPHEGDKAATVSEVTVTVHILPKTQRLRFVVRDLANGRLGTVDLNPAAVASRR